MDRRVVAVGIAIIVMAVIITIPKIFIPTGQHAEPTLKLPAPSPTWLFSSISPLETAQAAAASPKAAAQPTPTPHPEMIRRGQRLYYGVGCFNCHGVKAEGIVGPQIAGTGLRLGSVIQQVHRPEEDMPAFSPEFLTENDVVAIYAYLQSLDPAESRPQITTDHPDSTTGEALYRYFGCFGCHGYQGEGGFGLRLAGTQLSLEEVRAHVREPRLCRPGFGPELVSDEELVHIYAFLQNLAPEGGTK